MDPNLQIDPKMSQKRDEHPTPQERSPLRAIMTCCIPMQVTMQKSGMAMHGATQVQNPQTNQATKIV